MTGSATPEEMMAIAASRLLADRSVCFVGVGIPSIAANLAKRVASPDLVLVYESGAIGVKPAVLPLSIGDPELAATADVIVPMAELFSVWLQGGRIDVGFLGAAQVDRFCNLNSTVIGEYERPTTRLPGAGGAPDIAMLARETLVMIKHDRSKLVEKLDFMTSCGYLSGADAREQAGLAGGPRAVVTDLAVLCPDPRTRELVVTQLHPGVSEHQVVMQTGWPIKFSDSLTTTPDPTDAELTTLRAMVAETAAARLELSRSMDWERIGRPREK